MPHSHQPQSTSSSGQPKKSAAPLIILNALLIIAAACLLGWLAMVWLGVWTNHGKTATVPQVKGLSFERATAALAEAGMEYELNDSVYDSHAAPGTVLEQNPKAGNQVKPGRTVYLSINAFYPRQVTVPSLVDISLRQARSILEGLGFTSITERRVVSEYPDLVLGAECEGRPMTAGTRLPVTARVTLLVGDGCFEEPDTLSAETPGGSAPAMDDALYD